MLLQTDAGSLYQGDALAILPSFWGARFDVVFADPPFNLAKPYPTNPDNLPDDAYYAWCCRWLDECVRVLKPGGALWLYHLPRWAIRLGAYLMDRGLTFRHQIAISQTNRIRPTNSLYPSHYSLLYLTRGEPTRFSRLYTPIEKCRHCGGELRDYGGYRDKLNPAGISLKDLWTDVPVVRRGKAHPGPTLHPRIPERAISISTQPGDLLLDPFVGQGAVIAAAERLGRRWVGIEAGDCEPARLAVEATKRQNKRAHEGP